MTKMGDTDRVSEVNLRRLISSCEKMGQKVGEGSFEKDSNRTFMKYLQAAEKQRDDLAASNTVQKANLDEYSRKIEFLHDLINSAKMALPVNTAPTMHRLATTTRLTQEQKTTEAHTRLRAKRQGENSVRSSLFANHNSDTNSDDLTREEILQNQRDIQQSITEGMANLTANLKDNSHKLSNIIKDGNKSLAELQTLAENNVGTILTEGQRLKQYAASTSWSTLTLCVLLVLVMMVFIGTYVFMKIFPKN